MRTQSSTMRMVVCGSKALLPAATLLALVSLAAPAQAQVYSINSVGYLVHLRGDVDGDGFLELSDATQIAEHLSSGAPASACNAVADLNANGCVDSSDFVVLLEVIYRPIWRDGARPDLRVPRRPALLVRREPCPRGELRARARITWTFGRLYGRDAALLELVVFSVYGFVLAPCLAAVRSASM